MKDPNRFAQAEAAFHRLSALPGERREEELQALFAADETLAREVAGLLEADGLTWKLGGWLRGEASPEPTISTAGDRALRGELPERIGGFRVLGELGRGGMGVVYLGERDDEFHQRAALKVVKRGMDTEEIAGRMRRERQILAKLEHPNIARLIDGGTTADGRPYFAMEHIEGQTLLEWCDGRGLGVETRIRLFLDVCGAVEYAHRNLVIHRDLKPSNILVTEEGVAKLLDFGIAKLLASSADLRTTTGQLLLTPEYASPEQVLGESLTTASDVYSLGVILHTLLTGVHPYGEQVRTMPGLFRFAHEAPLPRASTSVPDEAADGGRRPGPPLRPAQLARRLRGDLDNILSVATRREPERRYPSVAELAEDLRRHLDRRPVKAHPESFGYRLSRFIARQRLFVAAAGLVFLSLAGGIAGTSWQALRAERARGAAEEQAELAGTVTAYLVEIFGEPDPGRHLGEEPKAREILARGRERLESLDGQPELLATLALVIGQAYQKLGDHAEAEKLYERSLDVRSSRRPPPDAKLVESLLYLADARSHLGLFAAARRDLQAALEQQESLGGGGEDGDAEVMATLLNDLGANDYQTRDLEAAEKRLTEALRLRRERLGGRHPETAQTLMNLAVVRVAQDDLVAAAELMTTAVDILGQTLGSEHPESLNGRANLATTLLRLGRVEPALDQYRRLIASEKKVFGALHSKHGRSLKNLGWILLRHDRPAEAIAPLQEARQILAQTSGQGDAHFLRALLGLAEAHRRLGEGETALALYSDTLERLEALPVPQTRLMIAARSGQGRLLESRRRPAEAVDALCRAVGLRRGASLSGGSKDLEDREILARLIADEAAGLTCPWLTEEGAAEE